ncbi:t-SNARE [Tuber brumale]|nr:t-SNARE [Tuber brumale]
MGKLEKLAMLAKRKALFDDKPVEIAELTYIIKQDLSAINQNIGALQALSRQKNNGRNEESEHSKNVVVMLQGKLADVSVGFKEVLEVRTKNIQASRHRTDQFVSNVRPSSADPTVLQTSHSPLYSTPSTTPRPNHQPDLLSLDPNPSSSALSGPASAQQLALMEEGSSANSYISARSEAIEAIEKTITELGGIFSQLAQMVGEQSEMIQRIDHETEDVVANVEGGQRELLKYWSRVSSNRWLVVKMFGVLMIFFLLWVLIS